MSVEAFAMFKGLSMRSQTVGVQTKLATLPAVVSKALSAIHVGDRR